MATDGCGGRGQLFQLHNMAAMTNALATTASGKVVPYYGDDSKKPLRIEQQITALNTMMTLFRCSCTKYGFEAAPSYKSLLQQLCCPFIVIFTFFFVLFTFGIILWTEYSYHNMTLEFGNGLCVTRAYYVQRNCLIIY